MQLTISNLEAHKLAKLLAEETDETITTAVTTALRERLDRVRRKRQIRLVSLIEIGERRAALLKGRTKDDADHL